MNTKNKVEVLDALEDALNTAADLIEALRPADLPQPRRLLDGKLRHH